MAQIIRKTEASFPGPWLLDSAALAALDEIIDEQWSRLEAYKKREIASALRHAPYPLGDSESPARRSGYGSDAAEDGIRRPEQEHEFHSGDGRTITLTLSSGNKIRVNSFREAASDVHCQDHEISKIEVKFYCGGIRGDMVVPTPKSPGLSLVTLPEASDAADELFVSLNRWAEQYKPDLLRQWRSLGFPLWWIFALLLLAGLLALGAITGFISETNTWNTEVRQLLAAGVRVEDQSRVLELLLQKAAGLDQSRGTIHWPVWFVVVTVILAIVASLFSIRAHTAFEIGRGVAIVRRQRRYDWFLRKAIPTFLIMGVLASILGSFAFEFLWPK